MEKKYEYYAPGLIRYVLNIVLSSKDNQECIIDKNSGTKHYLTHEQSKCLSDLCDYILMKSESDKRYAEPEFIDHAFDTVAEAILSSNVSGEGLSESAKLRVHSLLNK